MDMHSGGGSKEPYAFIYIEAPVEEAKVIFYNRFGHSPERVTCSCCGEDYSIDEELDLLQATGYERNCDSTYVDEQGNEDPDAWVQGKGLSDGFKFMYVERTSTSKFNFGNTPHIPLSDYLKQDNNLVICKEDIKDSERLGELPSQGYV